MRHSAGSVSFCNSLFGKRCQLLQSAVSFCKALSVSAKRPFVRLGATRSSVGSARFCNLLSYGTGCNARWIVWAASRKSHFVGTASFCEAPFYWCRQLLQSAIPWEPSASAMRNSVGADSFFIVPACGC